MRHHKVREIIFLNGKFMPVKEASLSILTPGFLYGWGVFETMRACNNKIVYFAGHLKRIKESAKLLDIKCPYLESRMKVIIQKTIKLNSFKDAYVRLTLWKNKKGADALVVVKKYEPYPASKYKEGFRALVSSLRQNEASLIAQLKTTNYLLYRLAYKQAIEKGFDEALILNHKGYITEGARSNLFFARDKELFTPSLKCGCLDGITRKAAFDLAKRYKIKVFEGNFTVEDLINSDEAFLTNSLMGIMPLASVESRRIGRGELTGLFMKGYASLLRNENG